MKINEIKKKNGTTVYRASVYLGVDKVTGKKVKTSITARTKTELKNLAKEKQYEFLNGGRKNQRQVSLKTYQELAELWLDSYKLTVKPQTYKGIKGMLYKYLIPEFGPIKLDKLSTAPMQLYINDLSKRFVHYGVVQSINNRILSYGLSLQFLESNPARDVILPKQKAKKRDSIKFIDQKDLKKFLNYMEELSNRRYLYYFDFVLYSLLLATGCRFGECVALEWSDIDFQNNTISISKNYSRLLKIVGTPKSKAGFRTISIDRKTANMLKLYRNRQRQLFVEVGGEMPNVVFSTPTKMYQNLATRQEALDRRCQEVEIPRFTFHAFRHTHASLLLNAGINYKELQYRLGHSTLSMTMDIYGHISKDREKESVSFYEKAINSL